MMRSSLLILVLCLLGATAHNALAATATIGSPIWSIALSSSQETYNSSEAVALTIRVTNMTSTEQTFPTDVPTWAFVKLIIQDSDGQIIARDAKPVEFRHQTAPPTSVAPGEAHTLQDTVVPSAPQTALLPLALFGYHLKAGRYTAVAHMGDVQSKEITFTIK